MKDLDYYISQTSDPFIDQQEDQGELQYSGYIQYQIDSIIDTVGTPESLINYNIFFNGLNDRFEDVLSDDEQKSFLDRLLQKLIDVYNLEVLSEKLNSAINYRQSVKYKDDIFELFKFIESDSCGEFIGECLPYASLEALNSKDMLIQYLELNYKLFFKNFEEKKNRVPNYFYEFFLYATKENSLSTLQKLILKNVLAVYTKQIAKGVPNDHN